MAEEVKEQKPSPFTKIVNFYDKHHQPLMIASLVLLFFFLGVMGFHKMTTGEFLSKDITLSGGLLITINTDQTLDTQSLATQIETKLGASADVKALGSLSGGSVGYAIELEKSTNSTSALEAIRQITGLELAPGSYTIEDQSAGFGNSFWQSAVQAIILAFVFMSIVVFLYFRVPIPSAAIILCGFADTVGTMAIMNLIGMKLSTGGVAALLMIIGYSVDTDILLSSRLLKHHEGSLDQRIHSSIKTGLTMQFTAIAALTALWILTPATLLKQIAEILIIGLILDIFYTWFQNVGILRWYITRKGEHG
jgi:preprotein translocase subunit SecF